MLLVEVPLWTDFSVHFCGNMLPTAFFLVIFRRSPKLNRQPLQAMPDDQASASELRRRYQAGGTKHGSAAPSEAQWLVTFDSSHHWHCLITIVRLFFDPTPPIMRLSIWCQFILVVAPDLSKSISKCRMVHCSSPSPKAVQIPTFLYLGSSENGPPEFQRSLL